MCYSAEASFTAGTILTLVGAVLIKKFNNTKALFIALIPFFFGIQQFAEGFLWLGLRNHTYPDSISLAAQYTFLFFAEMFWPIWIPFAFWAFETLPWRKKLMGLLFFIGLAFFFYNGYYFLEYGSNTPRIINHSITYGEVPLASRIVYAIVTLGPFFLTSIRRMWIFGILNLIAFIIAEILYRYAFISVWCFAAAIITIGIFVLLEKQPAFQDAEDS